MADINAKTRGRPSGRGHQGKETRQHLHGVGIELIEKIGFEKATIRKMAEEAGVSPGLFYKYFPHKGAMIIELHEALTTDFENRWEDLEPGPWEKRAFKTFLLSLDSLRARRKALQSMIPVLVGSGQNIFSEETKLTRLRVESLFYRAISESQKPPSEELLGPLSRLIYFFHLAVLLFWLLDRSDEQKATDRLVKNVGGLMTPLSFLIKFPGAKKALIEFDDSFSEALLGV